MDIKLKKLFKDDKQLFQRMFNSIAEGIVVADANGEFLFFNKVAEEILGIGMQEINPEEWSDVYGCFYTDQITRFPSERLPLAQTIRTGKVSRETVFIKNSAKPEGVFIDISGSPIIGDNDIILGGIAVFNDITESKKFEISLLKTEERLKAQFKGFPIPTYVWKKVDEDFVLIDYNDAADKFTKGKIKQFLGITFNKMYPNPSDPIHIDFWSSFNNKKIVSREMTYQMQTTGEKKELNFHHVYIPPDLVVIHTEDITERKSAEMHLQKLSNAVEQTADAVLITNNKGIIEYVNPSFEMMTGYNKEETVGQTPRILKSGKYDKSFYKNLWRTILNGNPYKAELINKKKNGEYFWLQNTITPIKDSNKKIINFVSVIKDITEIKAKKEQEIRLKIAKEIQQRLYSSNVCIPGFDIAGKNFPADETGGDYFDIILTPEGNFWLTIADVSNHGIGPALIMAGTRAYLRAFTKTSSDPSKILELLNNVLHSDLDEFQYVTMLLIHINTINHEIEYSGAGHVPAYLLNSEGEIVHTLKSTGIPLGYIKNEPYENCKINSIDTGNILVLLTDGIIEAQNKYENEFGYEKIVSLIKSHKDKTSQDIIDHIYQEVCAFTHKSQHEDDITALICKLNDKHKH
ncbi:SpoIIE family protein phosphatase [Calditrichota bacterium]